MTHETTRELQAEVEQLRRRIAELEGAVPGDADGSRLHFLSDIIEHSQQPIAVKYPDGRIGFCNRAYCELTGYTAEELDTVNGSSVLTPPEWRAAAEGAVREVERTGRPVLYQKEYVRKNGARVPVEVLVHLVKDRAGDTVYRYGFVTDITERKRQERQLRERVKELTLLYQLSATAAESMAVGDLMQKAVSLIPPAWQYPDVTVGRIRLDDGEWCSGDFKAGGEVLSAGINVDGHTRGRIDVCYTECCPTLDEGPFLRQERALIDAMARILGMAVAHVEQHEAVRASNRQLTDANQKLLAKEQQLRASEQEQQRLVAAHEQAERIARTGFFERNWETGGGTWSPGFWRLLGLEPREGAQSRQDFMAFVHEDDAERVIAHMQRAMCTPQLRDEEFRIVRPNGDVVEIHAFAETHFDEDGRPLLTRGTFQDITQRKRAEESLRHFEWLLEKDAQEDGQSPDPYRPPYSDVTELNTSRVILDGVGREALSTLGRDLMDLLDTSVAVYEKNGDYAFGMFDSAWCRLMDSASFSRCGEQDTSEALACGKWLCHENCWNDSAKAAIESGEPTDIECVGGIHLYAAPIRAGDQVIGAINVGYGTPPHDEDTLEALAERFEVPVADLKRAASGYKPRPQFIIDVVKRRCEVNASLIGDIVERAQLKHQLAQADRMASLGMIAAGVAHEINNPLAYTLYNLETVAEDLPRLLRDHQRLRALTRAQTETRGSEEHTSSATEPSDLVERAEAALEGARRIRSVARALGTFSRVEDEKPGPIQISNVIENACNMANNEIRHRAQLVLDLQPTPPVLGSEGKLSQVFLNLLINAAHAIGEGDAEDNTISVKTHSEGATVVAEVSDTGRGIPPQNLGQIFEPFFTTKGPREGSGLGLAISRRIVEGFGGTISAQSGGARGASFTIRLPICVEEPAPTAEVPGVEAGPKSQGRLLIVDDEASMRAIMVRMLREYETVEATIGREARAILECDQRFDLIICDMMMPGISGMELHEWLSQEYPDLARRVIFMTGGAFTPRTRDYLSKVDNVRLEKPFSVAGLKKTVHDRLTNA